MPWLQLKINSSPDEAQAIESAMQKAGALSVTMEDNADQPIFEPELGETPLWQETRVTGLFEADIDSEDTYRKIEEALRKTLTHHQWQILEDKDWEREWMSHYHPIQCHDNLWICPSWTEPPAPDATNLMLDPGLAFGTGTHPTTFLCLKWIAQQDFHNKTVIDYGCGSGILGIAALLLGAPNVTGTDIDPQALIATKENINRNKLSKDAFPVFFPSKCPNEPTDFIFANILAGPLVELAPTLSDLNKPGGKICLSGVLATQQEKIVSTYSEFYNILEVNQKEEWICVIGQKK